MKPTTGTLHAKTTPIGIPDSFLTHFFRLIQAVKIHQDNNPVVVNHLEEFTKAVHAVDSEESQIVIRVSDGRLFFQGEKLSPRIENASLVANVVSYFEVRKLHGLSFATNFPLAASDQFLVFVKLLNGSEGQDRPAQWLEQQIQKYGLDWVEILPDAPLGDEPAGVQSHAPGESDVSDPNRRNGARIEAGKNAYVGSLAALKEISAKVATNKPGGVRKALRTVQSIVDLLMEDDVVLLGLSTIRDFDDYTYVHSVNVGILAMTLGSRIGLPRDSLEIIGICGLLHDLGKTEIPADIINKPGKLTRNELEEVQKHVLHGVRLILRLKATRDIRSKITIGPFEHHLKYDLSGYPKTNWKKPLSLYGRIISIADVYDALTSPRVYRSEEICPHRALALMAKGSGTDFDPILLKVFIKMIGIYPIGTLLKFDSGEIGLVAESSAETDPLRPQVVLLEKDSQEKYRRGATVKLSEKHSDSGAYKRNIVGSYHPCLYGIQPAQYLM